jgi:DNA-binding MarR family transcriptional regulator
MTKRSLEPWLERWHAVRPDIDPIGIAIVGRLIRLVPAFTKRRSAIVASLGLTLETSDLVISLFRTDKVEGLNARDLRVEATFPIETSGAWTYRIDRAEAMGLVERRSDPNDRRGVIVALTERGRELALRDVDMHMALIDELLADFTKTERTMLGDLLCKLLGAFAKP